MESQPNEIAIYSTMISEDIKNQLLKSDIDNLMAFYDAHKQSKYEPLNQYLIKDLKNIIIEYANDYIVKIEGILIGYGYYVNGKKEGIWIEWHRLFKQKTFEYQRVASYNVCVPVAIGEYKNSDKQGIWNYRYSNGYRKKGEYITDNVTECYCDIIRSPQLNKYTEQFRDLSSIIVEQCVCKKAKMNGIWKHYDNNDNMVSERIYKNGKRFPRPAHSYGDTRYPDLDADIQNNHIICTYFPSLYINQNYIDN